MTAKSAPAMPIIRLVKTNRPFRAVTIWTFPDLCQTTVIPMGMLSNGKHGSKVLPENYISSGWPALKTRWMCCTSMEGQNWSNCWTIYLTRQTLISLTPVYLSTSGAQEIQSMNTTRQCANWTSISLPWLTKTVPAAGLTPWPRVT